MSEKIEDNNILNQQTQEEILNENNNKPNTEELTEKTTTDMVQLIYYDLSYKYFKY